MRGELGRRLRDDGGVEGCRDPRVALEFNPESGGTAFIRFDKPQRAPAAGQVLALYDGPRLLGGGIYA